MHPQVLPSSHIPHLMRHHMLLALLQGTSSLASSCHVLCYYAVQASITSHLITALTPARLPPVPSVLPMRRPEWPFSSVSSRPSSARSLRGCLSLQHPPKSFPWALLLSFLISGLASMSPWLHHTATQEHALRATAWGPRPHCTEHATPRCPIEQRLPSLTTR